MENSQRREEAVLEDITEVDIASRVQGNPEHLDEDPEQVTPPLKIRRITRVSRPTQRYSPSLYYLLLTDGGEPECYAEAMQVEDSVKWELAMKEEMNSLEKNQTWVLTKLPEGKKALQNKWVYRVKEEHDGKKMYKARLVVKGFQQLRDIDYTEVFSPVVKMTTIRLVFSIVAAEDLHLE